MSSPLLLSLAWLRERAQPRHRRSLSRRSHLLLLLVLFSATSALPSRPAASRRALNRDWYARRAAADPAAGRKRRGSRASRAERAADALYAPVSIDPSVCFPGLAQAELEAAAERLLADCHATSARQPPPPQPPPPAAAAAPAAAPAPAAPPGPRAAAIASRPPPPPPAPSPPPPPPPAAAASPAAASAGLAGGVMWGDCSVGPVLRQRLVGAGLQAPTAIQSAAFGPLSRGSNGLLSAQTGAGQPLEVAVSACDEGAYPRQRHRYLLKPNATRGGAGSWRMQSGIEHVAKRPPDI